jgi:hypothetical protein
MAWCEAVFVGTRLLAAEGPVVDDRSLGAEVKAEGRNVKRGMVFLCLVRAAL